MANDDIFTAINEWVPVQANGQDITNGTFSIVNTSDDRVDFIKSDTAPVQTDKGSSFISKRQESNKYTLEADEKLYCQAASSPVEIGVIQA